MYEYNTLRVVSLNINGLGMANKKFLSFLPAFYHQLVCDVVMLQETHGCEAYENYWSKSFQHKLFFAHDTTKRGGLIIGINKRLNFEVYDIQRNAMFLIVHCRIEEEDMVFVNVYLPQCHDVNLVGFAECLQEIWVAAAQYKCDRLIFGGDWNAAMDSTLDRKKSTCPRSGVFRSFVQGVHLTDIWRVFHPGERVFTYSKGGGKSRPDLFLLTQMLLTLTVSVEVVPVACSDHDAVVLDLFMSPDLRGPGLWRFPNWLLELPDFVTEMEMTIDSFFASDPDTELSYVDKINKWEGFKGFARQKSINFVRNWRRKSKKSRMVQLSKIILELESRSVDELLDEEEREAWEVEAEKLRIDLKELGAEKSPYPSRHENEVRLTAEMFAYVPCRPGRLSQVFLEGREMRTEGDILLACQQYFFDLYVDTNKLNGESFKLSNFAHVPEENRCPPDIERDLIEDFTIEEFKDALFGMKNNSAPGEDGLTAAFYKKFWNLLGPHLTDSLLAGIDQGLFSATQRRGIIKLLPKPGKDPRFVKNMRPITLLNVDFKIITKALSLRLSPLMHNFVHMDQKGFVKGRYLGEQVLDIYAVQDIATKDEAILLLDIRKAFDSVSWLFLENRLRAYGFPWKFIKLIRTLFRSKELRVYNNGYCSEPIFPTQGLAQGCSLSPLLFLLAIEGLAHYIRTSSRFEGICYKGREKRIGLVADDTALYIKVTENNLNHIHMVLDHFGSVSGLKINVEKCMLVSFAKINPQLVKVQNTCKKARCNYNVTSIRAGFKYLGIFISTGVRLAVDTNFMHISRRVVAHRFFYA